MCYRLYIYLLSLLIIIIIVIICFIILLFFCRLNARSYFERALVLLDDNVGK